MNPGEQAPSADPRLDPDLVNLLASVAADLEGELRRLVDAPPPEPVPVGLDWEAVLEARWQVLGVALEDHAQPLTAALRELAGCEPLPPGPSDSIPCPLATPTWYALEARGLRETFLLAVPAGAVRAGLERRTQSEFERLLERHGFAADHASVLGALLAAAGRDLAFLSSLLQSAAEGEVEGTEEPATAKRQLTRIRKATRSLDGLSGRLEVLAAAFEAEASERPGEPRREKAP